jgi:hypothetical protein
MSNGSYGIVFLGQAKRLGSFPSHRTVGGTIKVNHSLALGLGCLVIAVGGHGHVLPLILCTYACKTAAADQFFRRNSHGGLHRWFGFRNWVDTNSSPPTAIIFPPTLIESLIYQPPLESPLCLINEFMKMIACTGYLR